MGSWGDGQLRVTPTTTCGGGFEWKGVEVEWKVGLRVLGKGVWCERKCGAHPWQTPTLNGAEVPAALTTTVAPPDAAKLVALRMNRLFALMVMTGGCEVLA